jgi:hypothetical protein
VTELTERKRDWNSGLAMVGNIGETLYFHYGYFTEKRTFTRAGRRISPLCRSTAPPELAFKKDGIGATRRPEGHGFGLAQIKSVAVKYNGIMESAWGPKTGKFSLRVLLRNRSV